MKALTIKQPYAQAVADGIKTLEVRSWQTSHRGALIICASAAPKTEFWSDDNFEPPIIRQLYAGCVLAQVNVVDVRPMVKADEYEGGAFIEYQKGAFVWVLEHTGINYRPDAVTGKLKLFEIDESALVRLGTGQSYYDFPPTQGVIKYNPKTCEIV
jgi:hypothetical protein